jgi:hypothetical protein
MANSNKQEDLVGGWCMVDWLQIETSADTDVFTCSWQYRDNNLFQRIALV